MSSTYEIGFTTVSQNTFTEYLNTVIIDAKNKQVTLAEAKTEPMYYYYHCAITYPTHTISIAGCKHKLTYVSFPCGNGRYMNKIGMGCFSYKDIINTIELNKKN
jgi:hypothetical protein